MHCLRAAVALVAAMMFSLSAAGQTRPAAKIGTVPGKVAIRRLSRNAVSPNVAGTMIPERNVPTFIAGLAEIDPDTCVEVALPGGAGTWTVTLNPMFGATSTKIETGTAAPGQPCAGDTFTFNDIYYTWTALNNHTTTPGQGPTDIFNATWSTPDGEFNDPFVFNVVTTPVRPKGEMSTFVNWHDSRGNWMPTLIPPDKYPDFDFTGELIKEVTNKKSTCFGRGIGSMGSTGNVRLDYSVDSSWTIVNKVMFNQNDIVGWSPCGVEYYRCVKAALPACGYTGTQDMQIKSPADSGYTTYTTNNLSATIDGWIVPFAPYKFGIGYVTSQRSNPAAPQPPQSKFFPTSENNCPTVTTTTTTAAVLPCSAEPFAE